MAPTIERVQPNELTFASSLQSHFKEEVGFLPTTALRFYAAHGGITQIYADGDPAGYLVATVSQAHSPEQARIYQAAICLDLQRRQLGRALVDDLARRARATAAERLVLWCASELAANEFWAWAGFTLTHRKPGGSKRGRVLNLWQMALQPTTAPPQAISDSQEERKSVREVQSEFWHPSIGHAQGID